MINKEHYSTAEVAKLLGVSRVTVFNRIKSGKLEANKIGRNFIIAKQAVSQLVGMAISPDEEQIINKAIKKTVKEYGETLKLLGAE